MIELGLQRISRLLAKTPLPWRAIHVAGTNGKGSVCAYTSAMLEAYNQSTYRKTGGYGLLDREYDLLSHGRFTSPHLIDRWDCITINQETVSQKLFQHIEKQVLRRNEQEEIKASEFELLTATAFEIFTHENLDVGVVEVGMGGRLDATNVIGLPVEVENQVAPIRAMPLVTAITSIGLDHQAFLGDTLAEIAKEKSGIMKFGVPVTYDRSMDKAVLEVIFNEARAKDCPTGDAEFLAEHFKRTTTHSEKLWPHVENNLEVAFASVWIALQGLGRVPTDCSSVFATRESDYNWAEYGKPHDEYELAKKLIQAAKRVQFPGRQQRMSLGEITGHDSQVLLDGAHNAQSATALRSVVSLRRDAARKAGASDSGVTWVLAFSSTKDITEMLEILLEPGDRVFAVEFGPVDGMPWVEPTAASKIVQATQHLKLDNVEVLAYGRDLRDALKAASQAAGDKPMVVAGSLYLVGDVLRLLRDYRTT